jgi:hypothetical protein
MAVADDMQFGVQAAYGSKPSRRSPSS